MTRTRVRRRRLAVSILGLELVALVAVLGPGWASRPTSAARPVAMHAYVVRPGDTLWGIAERYSGGDPRPLLNRILERNRVSPGRLVPGQTLVVPTGS